MEAFVKFLESNGIELVAWDFDRTLISVHSGGQVRTHRPQDLSHIAHQLVKSVTPDFASFLRSSEGRRLKHVVASHADDYDPPGPHEFVLSGQTLIETVLKAHEFSMPVFAANVDWRNRHLKKDDVKLPPGKLWHLGQAMKMYGISDKRKVVLIDDDYNNIAIARANGFRAVRVRFDQGFCFNSLDYGERQVLSIPPTIV